MTQFYLANCTTQNHVVGFRLPNGTKTLTYDVPAGQQRPLGDFDKPELEAVVRQLTAYGLRSVDDVKRAESVVPYIYSLDRPVPLTSISKVIDHNQGVYTRRGQNARKMAAIAANSVVEAAGAKGVEVEIEEEVKEGDVRAEKPLGEGFVMDKGIAPPRGSNRRR